MADREQLVEDLLDVVVVAVRGWPDNREKAVLDRVDAFADAIESGRVTIVDREAEPPDLDDMHERAAMVLAADLSAHDGEPSTGEVAIGYRILGRVLVFRLMQAGFEVVDREAVPGPSDAREAADDLDRLEELEPRPGRVSLANRLRALPFGEEDAP